MAKKRGLMFAKIELKNDIVKLSVHVGRRMNGQKNRLETVIKMEWGLLFLINKQ